MANNTKNLDDIAAPGKSLPASNSKNTIVNDKPLVKDSMIVEGDKEEVIAPSLKHKVVISPSKDLIENLNSPNDLVIKPTEPVELNKVNNSVVNGVTDSETIDQSSIKYTDKQNIINEASDKEQEALLKKYEELIDSKKYFLPINVVSQKKIKRFIIIGIILIVILLLVWVYLLLNNNFIYIVDLKFLSNF